MPLNASGLGDTTHDESSRSSTTEVVGIDEQADAPSGETGQRRLYADSDDGKVYKVNPDDTVEELGGGGDFSSGDGEAHTIFIQSGEPASWEDGDIWIEI